MIFFQFRSNSLMFENKIYKKELARTINVK